MHNESKPLSSKNHTANSSQDMRMKKGNLSDSNQDQEEETELLSHLDENRLTKLKNEFLNKPEGLLLNEFLEVMLSYLEYSKHEELKISMRLIDLFKEIDVNGDQHLEW